MSHKFTNALSKTNEIVDLLENYDSEIEISRNLGNRQFEKHAAEDDINRLFKSVNVGRAFGGVSQKSAVKRPTKSGPSSSGTSESLDLKRALRGLCISQASEMATVKKRLLRPSKGLLGAPSALDIKEKLYRVVAVEARELIRPIDPVLGNSREVVLVSGKRPSIDSVKLSESRHLFVPGSMTEGEDGKRQKDKLWVENKGIEPSSKALDASRQKLKSLNLAKKKIVPKAAFVTKVVGDETNCRKADCFMDKCREELGKLSSRTKLVRFSQPKSVLVKAGEYSQSRENEGFSQSSKSSKTLECSKSSKSGECSSTQRLSQWVSRWPSASHFKGLEITNHKPFSIQRKH